MTTKTEELFKTAEILIKMLKNLGLDSADRYSVMKIAMVTVENDVMRRKRFVGEQR